MNQYNAKLSVDQRLRRLELENDRLRRLLDQDRRVRNAQLVHPRDIRWAITTNVAGYPTTDANTFPIRFLDPHYTNAAGLQEFEFTPRSNSETTNAHAATGQYIPPCVPIPVMWQRGLGEEGAGEWWILDPPRMYVVVLRETLHFRGQAEAEIWLPDPVLNLYASGATITVHDVSLDPGESRPAGTRLLAHWYFNARPHWIAAPLDGDVEGDEDDDDEQPGGATTPQPCSGRCRWIWNDSDQIWELDEDTCSSATTTTSSTTTSTTTSSTTTTTDEPDPCILIHGDPGATTTEDPESTTTTTTPAPDAGACHCLYPAFCGENEGESTYTYCASGYVPPQVECTTSTTCDCNTTTAAPECSHCCEWVCTAGGWVLTKNDCGAGCTCEQPPGPCAHCDQTTTGSALPCGGCSGTCRWIWYDGIGWYALSSTCSSGSCHGCYCVKPSFVGHHCAEVATSCQAPEPDPPCPSCYGSTTTTSTTFAPGECGGSCKWQWDPELGEWVQVNFACSSGCACENPAYDGSDASEVAWTHCRPVFTTTTTTTTSTTTTAEPGCCPGPGRCVYYFNYDTRQFSLEYDECPDGCDCPPVLNQCLPCMDSGTSGVFLVQTSCGRFNMARVLAGKTPDYAGQCSDEDCTSANCDEFFTMLPYPDNPSFFSYTCGGGDCFGGPTTTTTL